MDFIHAQEYLNEGDIVRVTLDKQANFRIFDSINFSNFRNGRKVTYYGGLAKRSPAEIVVPYSGHWNIVLDLGGARGQIRYNLSYVKR